MNQHLRLKSQSFQKIDAATIVIGEETVIGFVLGVGEHEYFY